MRTPKLPASFARGQFYRYYAGYSNEFVEDTLDEIGSTETSVILDPWNGSGTTTTIASARGIDSLGFDINPVAVILGRARLLGGDVAGSVESIAAEVCKIADDIEICRAEDPLAAWFGPGTTDHLRRIETAVSKLLVNEKSERRDRIFDPSLPHSSLAAGFYVVLFQLVRKLVRRYVPSNPTWIKNPSGPKLGISKSKLYEEFRTEAARFGTELSKPKQLAFTDRQADGSARIEVGQSAKLPLKDGSVTAVLSSPPYCTRIDYVKATLPELAIMGLDSTEIRQLRDLMIGTPTMSNLPATELEFSAPLASEFLSAVAAHTSRASGTYYRKYYHQYFAGMERSLKELRRVLEVEGKAVLVVQDSYYKDIHLDLASIIGDMAVSSGWKEWSRIDFVAPRTMASINSASRRYRSNFKTVESALIIQK